MYEAGSIDYFIQANPVIAYAIVFLGMLIEGEGVILFASIFAWQGIISWGILAPVVIFGTIIGDLLWYAAGKYLRDTKFGLWLDRRYERSGRWVYENIVSRYASYALISKFMYFTTKPTIFLAGWHNLEFKKFLKSTIIATLLWAAIILGIGFFFGAAVHLIGYKRIIRKIEIFAVILFAGVFIFEFVIKRFFFKKEAKKQL